MKVREGFIREILQAASPQAWQELYDGSRLIQYLDAKTSAVHGNSKTRRSLGNIYAIYSLLHFYTGDYFQQPERYRQFMGYEYMRLFRFFRSLYGGSKLQNHALNSRVNGEFRNMFPDAAADLIIVDDGRYLLHIDYLYVDGVDVSRICCGIIERYIELLRAKDGALASIIKELFSIDDEAGRKSRIKALLSEDAEARVFEIISFVILKNHYLGIKVYFGYSLDDVKEEELQLFKTGRTNANDGGIDFVMRPVGRFFQVTESGVYDKYLLDIDKVMHFPVTFVVKTRKTRADVSAEFEHYVRERTGGMKVLAERYAKAVEEIITINEIEQWVDELDASGVDGILRDMDVYYRLEMNLDGAA